MLATKEFLEASSDILFVTACTINSDAMLGVLHEGFIDLFSAVLHSCISCFIPHLLVCYSFIGQKLAIRLTEWLEMQAYKKHD